MRKTFHKMIAATLTGVLMASLFAGCGSSQTENGPTHTPVPTTKPTQAPTAAPTQEPENTPAPTQAPENTPAPTAAPTAQPTEPAGPSPAPGQLVFESWDGVTIQSHGTLETSGGRAQIVGEGVTVSYVDGGYVLSFDGDDGYLELPKEVFAGVTDGFTVTYRYLTTGEDKANVFQTNLCGYGVGDTQWRDAPELSLAVDGTFRAYVGGRTINGVYSPYATYNNGISGEDDPAYAEPGGHKVRYEAETKALSKNEWHDVIISVSKEEVHIYFDGEEVALTPTAATFELASTLDYLLNTFVDGKNILSEYVHTSFGNSVYIDCPNFEGMVDDIYIYHKALTTEDLLAASTEPAYVWQFGLEDVHGPEETADTTDLSLYMGETKLTEVTELAVASPDGETRVQFWVDGNGSYYYSVTDGSRVIIETSLLGMELSEGNLYEGLTLKADSITRQEINETYELFTGNQDVMENHCNELTFVLENAEGSFILEVRVHDDGFAYRYAEVTAGRGTSVKVLDEKSEIILPETSTTWAFELNGTYEGTYIKRNHSQLESLQQKLSTPMLVKIGDCWMMLTEAAAINNDGEYCTSALQTVRGSASMNWSFGLRRDPARESTGELDSPGKLPITEVNTVNGFTTPWRAAVISADLNEFINSSLISDLNPVADEELYADTSYIKPGKVAWSWWSEDADQGVYSKHVEYIDFAAENGWEYVCLDAHWRNFERRLDDLCEYAKEKGVGVFVWVNYRDIKDPAEMERLFSAWKEAGIVGLKTDYFESDDTNVLLTMQQVAECSAKYKLMVLYHGCVRPGGECRTYPNILSTEAVLGEECHKWAEYPSVENCLLYTFTRNICGSMDYTPAGTKVDSEASYGFCLAQTIVYESALQHFAYAAASYRNYNGLALLNHVPTEWNETILIGGYPGENVTIARRNGENWFIGSMTAEERTVEIKLDFLDNEQYNAYVYEDKEDGTGIMLREFVVTQGDTLVIKLCEGGGAAVMITKGTIDTTVGENEAVNPSGYTYYEAEDGDNILTGSARKASSAFCAGGQKVGFVGYAGNTLTFTQVEVPEAGTYKLLLYYCSGEDRRVTLKVNGATEYVMSGLNSGDYVHTAISEIEIVLKKGINTIEFSNASYYAPDIDRIAISEKKIQ